MSDFWDDVAGTATGVFTPVEKWATDEAGKAIPGLKNIIPGGAPLDTPDENNRINTYNNQMVDASKVLATPKYANMKSAKYNDVGDINAEEQGPTQLAGISVDPQYKQAELNALNQYADIVNNGGMDATYRNQLDQALGAAANQNRGQQQAILQNAEMRGMGGGNQSLLAQLQSAQGADTQARSDILGAQDQASQRQLQALSQYATQGQNLETQDYGQQLNEAQAQDLINQFNTNTLNQTNQYNNTRQQQTATNQANANQQTNQVNATTIPQAKHAAAMDTYNAQQNALQNAANNENTVANRKAGTNQAVIGGIAQVGAGATKMATAGGTALTSPSANSQSGITQDNGYTSSDRRDKKDVSDIEDNEIMEFLKALKPKHFEYKEGVDHGTMGGEREGLMAQDIEHTKLGKNIVKNTPTGKKLDRDNLNGVILAALKHLLDV